MNTVDVLYNDCTGPQTNCRYTELFLHRYNDSNIYSNNVVTVNVRYNDARLSDNHDITTKSRKTVFLH